MMLTTCLILYHLEEQSNNKIILILEANVCINSTPEYFAVKLSPKTALFFLEYMVCSLKRGATMACYISMLDSGFT